MLRRPFSAVLRDAGPYSCSKHAKKASSPLTRQRRTAAAEELLLLFTSRRTFAAFGTNWKETSKRKKKKRQKHQNRKSKGKKPSSKPPGSIPETSQSAAPPPPPPSSVVVPPLFVLPTASPNAYVARAAAVQSGIDPKQQLFRKTDLVNDILSSQSRFEYFGTSGAVLASSKSSSPEVAFLGRSNVGKSSLLNALMGQSLARTSKQPGRTQHAHYYGWILNTPASSNTTAGNSYDTLGFLVDLPGYGFAVGPQNAVDKWQQRTQNFLLRRRHDTAGLLRRVYLLVDSRHGPTDFDASVMRWLDEGELPYTIVLTKCDAVKKPALIKHINQVCMRYQHESEEQNKLQLRQEDGSGGDDDDDGRIFMSPVVHVTSSRRGTGVSELLWSIETEFYNHDEE